MTPCDECSRPSMKMTVYHQGVCPERKGDEILVPPVSIIGKAFDDALRSFPNPQLYPQFKSRVGRR